MSLPQVQLVAVSHAANCKQTEIEEVILFPGNTVTKRMVVAVQKSCAAYSYITGEKKHIYNKLHVSGQTLTKL